MLSLSKHEDCLHPSKKLVMRGLDPRISSRCSTPQTEMPGSSPGMTVLVVERSYKKKRSGAYPHRTPQI
jgi:hypothetical protein